MAQKFLQRVKTIDPITAVFTGGGITLGALGIWGFSKWTEFKKESIEPIYPCPSIFKIQPKLLDLFHYFFTHFYPFVKQKKQYNSYIKKLMDETEMFYAWMIHFYSTNDKKIYHKCKKIVIRHLLPEIEQLEDYFDHTSAMIYTEVKEKIQMMTFIITDSILSMHQFLQYE